MTKLTGKNALVTGGASGIGRAVVELFRKEGAQVVAVDRDETKLAQMMTDLGVNGPTLHTIATDLSSEPAVVAAAKNALDRFGSIDILVNNAGLHDEGASLFDIATPQWEKTFAVNVSTHYWLARQLLPGMVERGSGAIIAITSAAGLVGGGGGPAYTASKHAAVGLSKALAVEFGPRGIRCNAIAPGVVMTPMLDALPDAAKSGFSGVAAGTAARRLGEPHEIAAAVLFLASDAASFMYGAVVPVDGGYTAV
ncbi:MAG TPA: glucose 1-dehydrogenase [Micromonosporaceae bacterium]|nr:glucose 1-dehydrogenase [Micromonosporaceae bacterium]